MQVAEVSGEASQQLVRTYAGAYDLAGAYASAESQFETECQTLIAEGWQLKQVSHRGTIVVPSMAVEVVYAR